MSSSQIFETNQVTQCQKVSALWQKRAQDTPTQVMAQRPKRANWCTHCGSFQPWEGSWNSAIAQGKACSASSVPLVWHPHQHTVLRQDKSVLRAGHRAVALQSLTSHHPKLHDKTACWEKMAKEPWLWSCTCSVGNFTVSTIPSSYISHVSPDFITPESHFLTISSRKIDYHILSKLIFKRSQFCKSEIKRFWLNCSYLGI